MDSYFKILAELYGKLITPGGKILDLGLLSSRYITDAYAEYYINCLLGTETGIADFKYHDSGTGTTAEAVGNTTLETPTGIARVTGTQVQGATVKTFQSIATITYDGNYEITEWGIFNALTGNTLMDRAVFTARSVANGYQFQFTYNHTALSGG